MECKKVKERQQSGIKIEHWMARLKVESPETDGINNTEPAVTPLPDKLDRPNKSKGLAISSKRTSPRLHSASIQSLSNGRPNTINVKHLSPTSNVRSAPRKNQTGNSTAKKSLKARRPSKAKSTKMMCESMGRKIYVNKPCALPNCVENDDECGDSDTSVSVCDSLGDESDMSCDTNVRTSASSSSKCSLAYSSWSKKRLQIQL
jgi:hypothetical protein